jgi:GT2 family glycosyltransferase
VIREYASIDSRIKFVLRPENGHIAEATNSAAGLATGEFVGFLDHDDELREHALYMVAKELNAHREADLLYSDEDKITEDGERYYPHFKPDWNLELLLCQNYVCHFTVVRTSLFRKLGGIRKGFDGAQDWDFVLRASELTTVDRIRHIPHILYHWRVLEGSTAKGADAKPYVTEAQVRAVSEYLARNGAPDARVVSMPSLSMLRVHYPVREPRPLVSVIIPTYNQVALLSKCIDGLLRGTSYPNLEVIIVDNRSDDPATRRYLQQVTADSRVRVARDDGAFNFARLNNEAVRLCNGALIAFLNNDIEVVDPTWLDEMVARASRPHVGAVGAKLLYPNGTIQHAGVLLGASGGIADHMFKHHSAHELGYFCRAILPQNVSAVTAACMLVSRAAFDQVNGFDETAFAVAYNDIDFCLRLRAAGYLIVYTPYAELIHHESVSRGYEDTPEKRARFEGEASKMLERWGSVLAADPYYNPNFSLDRTDFTLGMPRRLQMPWA